MNRTFVGLITIVLVFGASGCSAAIDFLLSGGPEITTVVLVNNSDFSVDVELYYGDEQESPEALLKELGDELNIPLAAGEQTSFFRDCDDLQAIFIDDADLNLIGQIGPEANTDVLRDGSDFGCGDTITFTFDHSEALFDFDISVSVQDSDL